MFVNVKCYQQNKRQLNSIYSAGLMNPFNNQTHIGKCFWKNYDKAMNIES